MRNPFKKLHEKRGLPDSTTFFHAGNSQHKQNNNRNTMIHVSSSESCNMVSEQTVPSGYPYNTNPPPPTAYPYAPPQPDEGVSTGAVWEFNTGENINKRGKQSGGNIKAGNTVAGSSAVIKFPENGRYVFNTGRNYNEGELQESGNVEFGNVIK